MTTPASGIVLGFLLATAYGSAFHLMMGGPSRQVVLYVAAAWVGFAIGHFIGALLNIELLKLGAVYLFSASLGAWIALVASWLLSHRDA